MQNIDFYDGSNTRTLPTQYNIHDPEYFSVLSSHHSKEFEKNKKNASRLIFFIASLCIISFTTGIIIGIKFAGGANKEIVDERTFNAFTGIGNRVSSLIKENTASDTSKTTRFPKNLYPYAIKIGNSFNNTESKKIASLLTRSGHTVILSKIDSGYKIYTGPYKSIDFARESVEKISTINSYLLENVKIIKR